MEKKSLLKKVASFGFVANKQALDKLSNLPANLVEKILQMARKRTKKPFLTGEIIDKLTKEVREKDKIDIKVEVLSGDKIKKKIEINDVVNYLLRRYQKISSFLSNRIELTNLLSIGKVKGKINNFSVIGLVREVDKVKGRILLEDPTGQIEIFFEDPNELKFIVPDEVIGVFCARKGSFFVGKRIVFPDVPVRKQIKRTNKKLYILFVCDADMYEKQAKDKIKETVKNNATIVVGFGSSEKILKEMKEYALEAISINKKGSLVKIQVNGVKIFCLYKDPIEKYSEIFGTDSVEALNQLLRKRHLDPVFNFNFLDEAFLLEEEPDILAVGGVSPGIKNYKGITLIACNKNIGWIIDLSTRESLKLEVG